MIYNNPSSIKILYMGTPKIAVYPLIALLEEGFDVVGVLTQADKESGRGGEITQSPVKKLALKNGIKVFQPERLRKDYGWAKELHFDLIVCMAYGQIVPEELLAMAPLGAVNFHGSLLPKYRGAAPMQRALMNGDEFTGVSLMEMVKEMDAGAVYAQESISLKEVEDYTSLITKMGETAYSMTKKYIQKRANGELPPIPQKEDEVTFANKITKEEEHIPLSLLKEETINYIRALAKEPGGYFFLKGKKIKVFKASVWNEETTHKIGEIVPNKKRFLLQLKDGIISLDEVQPEGKKLMKGDAFLNGARLEAPSYLE